MWIIRPSWTSANDDTLNYGTMTIDKCVRKQCSTDSTLTCFYYNFLNLVVTNFATWWALNSVTTMVITKLQGVRPYRFGPDFWSCEPNEDGIVTQTIPAQDLETFMSQDWCLITNFTGIALMLGEVNYTDDEVQGIPIVLQSQVVLRRDNCICMREWGWSWNSRRWRWLLLDNKLLDPTCNAREI